MTHADRPDLNQLPRLTASQLAERAALPPLACGHNAVWERKDGACHVCLWAMYATKPGPTAIRIVPA